MRQLRPGRSTQLLMVGLFAALATGGCTTDWVLLPPAPSEGAPPAVVTPPYRVIGGAGPQVPGTILFGDRTVDGLTPFAGFPLGFTIDRQWAYGAFFDRPAGAEEISITLNRKQRGIWSVVWSQAKPVAPTEVGYADILPRFGEPGLYRLDVASRGEVLATSLMRMEPPCVGVCTGG